MMAGKGASFFAQIILGWVLSKGDFAIYAIAISSASLVRACAGFGIEHYLTARSKQFEEFAGAALRLAIIGNVLVAGALILIGNLASDFYNIESLSPMLWVIAGSVLLQSPLAILRAHLTSQMAFKRTAGAHAVACIFRHAFTVIFALLGFGPLSFVWPLLIEAVAETTFLIAAGARLIWRSTGSFRQFKFIVVSSGWLTLANVGNWVFLGGDYLLLGKLLDRDELGVYFFGFQLTVSVMVLLSVGVRPVVLSTFGRIADDPPRLRRGFVRSARMLVMITSPCFAIVAVSAPFLVNRIWAGKWDEAIWVVIPLALACPLRMLGDLGSAVLESIGAYSIRAAVTWLDAVCLIIAVLLGAWLGGLWYIALFVAAYRAIGGLAILAVAAKLTGASLLPVAKSLCVYWFGSVGVAIMFLFLTSLY